ncbi:sodium/potassium/calcium exchanger 5-like [Asterias amurensis]|uniref:sodium/potassium/calcium exchanger 5-like n=1 Tax=Asterias amurensis TaxID=7602 RepID=UPI003AB25BA0
MALKCNWKVFMMVKMCFLCGVLLVKIGRVSLLAGGFTEENSDLEVKAAPQQRQDGRPPAISFISRKLREVEEDMNCTMPSITSFPRTLFTEEQREKGAIIIDFLAAFYLFGAISYVCFAYFVPSLEIISKMLGLQEDVAGATFMAIGSSAPEFFTAVVGAFVTHDNTGVSAIIGSSAFNVFVIIALCSLAAGGDDGLPLLWYPVIRDSICWLISLLIMIAVTMDSLVEWWEGLIMTVSFGVYITIMYFNKPTSAFVLNWTSKHFETEGRPMRTFSLDDESEETAFIDDVSSQEKGLMGGGDHGSSRTLYGSDLNRRRDGTSSSEENVESDNDSLPSVFDPPKSTIRFIGWFIGLPVILCTFLTVPDCRKAEPWRRCYPLTFVLSAVWLAGLSYLLYWLIVIIGFTLGIPDTVMGYTVLAIGTSVPDAIASLLVARDGFGDMAVANIIGSNVFEIFICLGFVWFLKSVTATPVTPITISINGLAATTIVLIVIMFLIVVAIHHNGWKLDMKIGIVSLLFYIAFIGWATLNAEGTFGDAFTIGETVAPLPPCPESYYDL